MESSSGESYFHLLPIEIIEIIFSFLELEDKDSVCLAYKTFYSIIYSEKIKFIDYNINLAKFNKLNTKLIMESKNSYIRSIKKHKRFLVETKFVGVVVDILGGKEKILSLPVIGFKKSYYGRGNFLDNIPMEDIKYRISIGEDLKGRGFAIFKYTKGYMCLFSRDTKDKFRWMCCYGGGLEMEDFTYLAIGKQYINFGLLSRIADFVHDPKIDIL